MIKSSKFKKKISPQTDYFCQKGIKYIDYKDTTTLRKFINSQWRIIPQSQSKLIRKNQLRTAVAIERARQMALLPYPDSRVEQEQINISLPTNNESVEPKEKSSG